MSLTELLKTFQTYDWDFGIELRVENENNQNFFIEAPLQTQSLIPEQVLKDFYQTAFNKEVRSFHILPEEDLDSFIGNVEKVWWDEPTNLPWCRIKIFNNSAWAREVRKIILADMHKPYEERRIKGVSAGVVEYRDKDSKEIVEIYIREISLAENPACDVCTFKTIILNSKNGGNIKLAEETNEKNLESIIKTFQARLDDKATKIKEYESTIGIQMETIAKQKASIEGYKSEIQEYEKVKLELSKMKQDAETFNARHKIITKYEKIEAGSDEYKSKMEELGKLPDEALNIMLKQFERVFTLKAKGLVGQQTKPALDTPQIREFDGINPKTMKGEDYMKEVDKLVDAESSEQYKGTGGY